MKHTTKFAALSMTAIMTANLLPMSIPASAADKTTLSDIKGAWCEEYVNDLVGRGIVGGYADGTYKASTPVTRGAIAKMALLSMQNAGSRIKTYTQNDPFTDMKGNWAEEYVVPLTQLNIVLPKEYQNKFSASTPMTRLETAKLLVRVYLHAHPQEALPKNVKLDFTDADQISEEDASYVAFAVEKGMITGYEDGSFKPNANINRGTAAAMMSRFLGKVGTIDDIVMGVGGSNRTDGEINQEGVTAPEIENVEWVVKPSLKIPAKTLDSVRWGKTSVDGMTKYTVDEDPGVFNYVDKNGKTYRFTGFSYVGDFVNGVASAEDSTTKLCGFIDVNGKWVVEPKYYNTKDFSWYYLKDGTSGYYAMVQLDENDNWERAIDETMQLSSTFRFSLVDREKTSGRSATDPTLVNGYKVLSDKPTTGNLWVISAMKGDGGLRQPYYGICDNNGKIIVTPKAATTSYGNDLHTAYYSGDVYDDCIVMTQQVSVQSDVVSDIYDGQTGKLIYTFADTQRAAEYYNIDYRGIRDYGQGLFTTVTKPIEYTSENSSSFARIGYMNKYGNMVIPSIFEDAEPFSNGFAWVKYNGAWGMIRLPE